MSEHASHHQIHLKYMSRKYFLRKRHVRKYHYRSPK